MRNYRYGAVLFVGATALAAAACSKVDNAPESNDPFIVALRVAQSLKATPGLPS